MVATSGRVTLWGIEIFVATAEEASISTAARRLGASAATVSQQLTNLEGAIGTTLLDRGARPVTLTPAGEMFLRRANTILNEAEQARAELAMADLSRLTRLRLGMIEDLDADVTPALLSKMGSEFKNCHFLLETGASHHLLDQQDARALDIVVAADVGAPASQAEVHPLLVEPFVVAVPRGSFTDGDLAKHLRRSPLIQYTRRHFMGRVIADHLDANGMKGRVRFELDSYHAIMAMIANRAGWSILTPLAVLRAGRFREEVDLLPLPFAPLSRQINLTARKDVMSSMPATIARQIRPLLQELIVDPALARRDWLADTLRVIPAP